MTAMDPPAYATEADLIEACRRQELAAFARLYELHGGRLKSVAYHVLGNRADAEDAVQEAFVKLYKAMAGFHGESTLGAWLCRIVINVSRDIQRRRKREADPPRDDQPRPRQEPGLKAALQDALGRINPRYRMVFLLFEAEGLRHAEIGAALGIPEGTSKTWLFEAKKELKRLLREGRR